MRPPGRGLRRALVLMAHPGHGGLMRSLASLDQAASRFGWQLHFVFPRGSHRQVEAARLAERAQYRAGIHHWRRLGGRLRLPVLLATLAREIRRHDAEVVYCATLSSFPYACLAARACGVGELVHVYSSYKDPAPYRKYWLGRARHAIAPSRDSLERAAAAIGGFAGRAEVIYNGVDVACIEAAAASTARVPRPDRGPRIGMAANLDRRKNPLDLVEAAARLVARFPTLEVLLVGGFPEAEYRDVVLERARALGIGARITVTGFLPNPFPLIDACDVVALPTRRDPFPIALLEAMALRKPVVATAVGGVPEMIVDGETGFLVPPGDVDALAARLAVLLHDRERRHAMGEAGRRRMETVFTLEGFLRGMFAAFDGAAAG